MDGRVQTVYPCALHYIASGQSWRILHPGDDARHSERLSLIAAANIEFTCLVTGPIMTCSRLWIRQRSRGLALVRCLLANVDSAPGSRRNCHGVSCLHVTTWFYIYGSRIIQSTGLLLIRSYTWNSMHGFHTSFSLHLYVSLLLMILVLSAFYQRWRRVSAE